MKKLIKHCLMWWGAWVHRDCGPKTVFYHDVGLANTPMGTDEKVFWSHMDWLRAEDQVCFDDGFRGVWTAREQFRQRGIRPKVFVAVRLVGQPGYLSWDEIRELQNDYGFTFECHTWSHQTLVGEMIEESPKEERTQDWYHRELVESREEIARQIGREVDELCFPVGLFSEHLIEQCKRAGYRRVYSCLPGNVSDDYLQCRNLVQDLSSLGFKWALQGGMSGFRRRYFRRHHVG